ncbi:MAG: type II toxin-antitoxin system ParD family antitoxin [Methylophaga sp.]|nr:MAG: type II toxin-antitoxin system ParD family antitoxin [Methylophaga sp.]
MNVSFTDKQEMYIAAQLESGDFQNASEVVRDALRMHQFYRHRVIDDLRAEIAKGWEGETSARSVEDIVKAKLAARAR